MEFQNAHSSRSINIPSNKGEQEQTTPRRKLSIKSLSRKGNDYWKGPYGVLVPNTITHVEVRDSYNKYLQENGESENGYKSRHAELRSDGKYYYKH